jgi:hypothetical protein
MSKLKDVIVIDNFYKSPDDIRKFALKSVYIDISMLNYPGYQSTKAFHSPDLVSKMESAINSQIVVGDRNKIPFGQFRYIKESGESRIHIHYDSEEWAGVLYLMLPEHCQGGTGFFRHKRTGLEGPPKDSDLADYGFESLDQFENDVIVLDTKNIDQWDIIDFVEAKYNRMVLFRGSKLFHGHVCQFGSDIENSRLTQNFFFSTRKL